MHDIDWSQAGSYEWLVDVWIPLLVGAASVLVAIAALVASGRARKIARAAEAARDADAARAREAELRSRVLEQARDEARQASKWVNVSFEIWTGKDVPADLRPSVAELAARTALQQSLVPGAALLYEITAIDTDTAFDRFPTTDTDGKPAIQYIPLRDPIVQHRQNRSLDRIRRWAADPDGAVESIGDDLEFAQRDVWAYLAAASPAPVQTADG